MEERERERDAIIRTRASVMSSGGRRGRISFLVVAFTATLSIISVAFLVMHQDELFQIHTRFLQEETEVHHKNLFPFSSRDAIGFSLAIVGLMIAAGGGIGGGGILVPIYILVLQFLAKNAIPLSNVTVFGGAVANTLLNIRKRHPLADRPLIDWNIILVMEPLTILGSLIGANLNKLLPEQVIVVLLVLLLSIMAFKTLSKAVRLHQTETYSAVHNQDDSDVTEHDNNDYDDDIELAEMSTFPPPTVPRPTSLSRARGVSDSGPLSMAKGRFSLQPCEPYRRSTSLPLDTLRHKLDASTQTRASPHSANSSPQSKLRSESSFDLDVQACTNSIETIQNHARNPDLVRILEEERRAPLNYVCYIASLFAFVLIINILKGGGAFPSPVGITCGSPSFWIAEAAIALVIVAVSCKARSSLLQRTRLKRDAGYQYLDCDIEWNETSTFVYPLLSCTAGLMAGMFGIGGGIIKGPLMLALGVHPAVASATSACMILFTSFTATTSFAVFGLLIQDYGLFCLIVGFVATLLGQTIMSMLLKRYQRSSYIAFSIGGVVLLSAICMTIESIISLSKGGGSGLSSGLCSTHLE